MIIDCHGHYTTAPDQLQRFRDAQLSRLAGGSTEPVLEAISDDELRESVEQNQLKVLEERGGDFMIFSPKASGMEHHIPDAATARRWAQVSNDLVARLVELYPDRFAGVCQLPQTHGGSIDAAVVELERTVEELGFIGCNINPDPAGGYWNGPPMTDPYWYPLYERMVALGVPGMIHVSSSCNPNFHTLGAHYLNADTAVFMQLLEGDLFSRFPDLKLIIPHGGGAVPYHWGRYHGLGNRMGRPPIVDHLMGNVFFDSCVYHEPGMRLLLEVVGVDNVLFASEMLGAVRGDNPATGSGWDDTKRYIDGLGLSEDERFRLFEENARKVYPRLSALLDRTNL